MKNYHILKIEHVAPTNVTPHSRVRIKSDLHKQSIVVPYTHLPDKADQPLERAIEYLIEQGFPIIGTGEINNYYIVIVDAINHSFKKLK